MSNIKNMLKINTKRLLAGVGTVAIVLAGAAAMSAFEAHVINVTATIENALNVSVDALDFGTVFPQEMLDQRFNVFLSESFVNEDRVDDVDYFIRQKPKCGVPIPDTDPVQYSQFVQVTEDEQGNFVCPEVTVQTEQGEVLVQSVALPLLCPYLSKEELTTDGPEDQENDGEPLSAFHGPISLAQWTMQIAQTFDVTGRLAKSELDTQDTWNIDLKVPCFGKHCAQDWESFVNGINDTAIPADYIQPFENEHQLYGCDLWLEVKGVSLTPEDGTLIIQKVLINDDQTGSADSPDDFSFTVNGGSSTPFEADGENMITATGIFDIVEDPFQGYSTTYDNCNQVQVDPGETETCIITNDDNEQEPALLVVNKLMVNNHGGNNVEADFQMTVDGNGVAQGVPNAFSPGNHTVSETGVSGYVATFTGPDCDSNGVVSLVAGQTKTCDVVNDDLPGSITLIKDVINDDNGQANANSFTLRIDGSVVPNNTSVPASANTPHTIDEDALAGYTFVSLTGTGCPATLGGTATLNEGESITCTIANDDNGPETLLSNSFGTSASEDIPDWNETGGASTEVRAAGSGNDTASPDGGAFAVIEDDEWMCRTIDATGFNTVMLSYYWRGDSDAEGDDDLISEIKPSAGNACADGSGWTLLQNHDLSNDGSWSTQSPFGNAGMENTSFLLRFRTNSEASEFGRIDGVLITGVPI